MIARLLTLMLLAGLLSAQNTVHYTATSANVKYLFATAEPVAHLKSGDILDTNTLDCFGGALRKPGDTLSMVKGDNPLTGPFFVEGAEPGDTLAVKILDLQVDGDTGVGSFSPRGLILSRFRGAERDALHACAGGAAARADLVLSHRPRSQHGNVQGNRFRFLGEDSHASLLWMHRRRAGGG